MMLSLNDFFRVLRHQKALGAVDAFNEAPLRLHEKLGFQHEGRLRRVILSHGAFHDEFVLGLLAEEFEAP